MTIKPTPINEQALDKAAREGYAVRCKTNGPRVLDQYASPDIMRKQLDDARVIVSAYLDALSVPAAAVVGEPVGDVAYNAGLEIRYAIAASGVDPIQHIPEVDAIIERRLAEARKAAFIEAAEMIEENMLVDWDGPYREKMIPRSNPGNKLGMAYAAALRAKAEEAQA